MTFMVLLKRGKNNGIAVYIPKETILRRWQPKLNQNFFFDLVWKLSIEPCMLFKFKRWHMSFNRRKGGTSLNMLLLQQSSMYSILYVDEFLFRAEIFLFTTTFILALGPPSLLPVGTEA
jgi:hypothetical protein